MSSIVTVSWLNFIRNRTNFMTGVDPWEQHAAHVQIVKIKMERGGGGKEGKYSTKYDA